MSIFILTVIALALSFDSFAGIYLNGFLKEASFQLKVKAVVFITLVNTLMVGLGFITGGFISTLLESINYGISLGILFVLGLKLIIKSFKPKFQEMIYELTRSDILLGFAFALGINSFLLGLALPSFNLKLTAILPVFGIVFFIISLAALIFGARSNRYLLASRLMFAGGIVISGSAVYYIIEHFNFI